MSSAALFDVERHVTFYEDDDCSNLSASQQHLLHQHRKVVEERKREQELQKLEIQRLDAILKMCEHYASTNSFSLQRQKSNVGINNNNNNNNNSNDAERVTTPPSNYATDGAVSSSSEDDLLLSAANDGAEKRAPCSSSSSSPDVTKDNGVGRSQDNLLLLRRGCGEGGGGGKSRGGRDSGVDLAIAKSLGSEDAIDDDVTSSAEVSPVALTRNSAATSGGAKTTKTTTITTMTKRSPYSAFSDSEDSDSDDDDDDDDVDLGVDEFDSRRFSAAGDSSIFNFSDLESNSQLDEGDYFDVDHDVTSGHYEDLDDVVHQKSNHLVNAAATATAAAPTSSESSKPSAESLSRQFPRWTRSSTSPASGNSTTSSVEPPPSPVWKRISQMCLQPPTIPQSTAFKVDENTTNITTTTTTTTTTTSPIPATSTSPFEHRHLPDLAELDEDARAIAEEIESVRSNDSKSPASSSPPPKPKRSLASLQGSQKKTAAAASAAAAAAASSAAAAAAASSTEKIPTCSSSNSLEDDVFAATSKSTTSSSPPLLNNTTDTPIDSPRRQLLNNLLVEASTPHASSPTSPPSLSGAASSPGVDSPFRAAASTPAHPHVSSTVSLGVSNITAIMPSPSDGGVEGSSTMIPSHRHLGVLSEPEVEEESFPSPPISPNKTKEQLIEELRQRDAQKRPQSRNRRSGRDPYSLPAQSRPLTRYLPIRGGADADVDFDLRLHVESSGHPLESCPEVMVDATTCRGYLTKIGGKFGLCRRRWFVFDRDRRSLTYYKDKTETKRKGGVYFQFIQETYPDHEAMKSTATSAMTSSMTSSTLSRKTASSSSAVVVAATRRPQQKSIFLVKTTERIFRLCAPTPEAMRIWVDVIFTGAEGYDTYAH